MNTCSSTACTTHTKALSSLVVGLSPYHFLYMFEYNSMILIDLWDPISADSHSSKFEYLRFFCVIPHIRKLEIRSAFCSFYFRKLSCRFRESVMAGMRPVMRKLSTIFVIKEFIFLFFIFSYKQYLIVETLVVWKSWIAHSSITPNHCLWHPKVRMIVLIASILFHVEYRVVGRCGVYGLMNRARLHVCTFNICSCYGHIYN